MSLNIFLFKMNIEKEEKRKQMGEEGKEEVASQPLLGPQLAALLSEGGLDSATKSMLPDPHLP